MAFVSGLAASTARRELIRQSINARRIHNLLLDTVIFDPLPCGFPAPKVPMLPTLMGGQSGGMRIRMNTTPSWASADHFRHFTRARYALHEAYRLAGVGPGTRLLAPSYHCRTMLDPALALGGAVALYPLHPDLSPDLPAIQKIEAAADTPIKGILITHYFGFPQDFGALTQWARQRRITIVEDCSHALLCERFRAAGTGTFGDFVASSLYKFLPIPDGGLLYASDAPRLAEIRIRPRSIGREIRGIRATLLKAWSHRRSAVTPDPVPTTFEPSDVVEPGVDRREQAGPSADYQLSEETLPRLGVSGFIAQNANIEAIVSLRRHNYQRWLDAVAGLVTCRPLYPKLPTGCVPYMFPLHIDHPQPFFYQLKRLGVPIWRWDSMAVSGCTTASDYRTRLLHLPCHQSLRRAEMDWMLSAVINVSQTGTRGGAA